MQRNQLVAAQIGCGYWGPNLLRNYSLLPNCSVKYVVELREDRRAYVAANFPKSQAIVDVQTVVRDADVDFVIIASQASTHFEMTKLFREAGKHVFVEKPLAMSVREADALTQLAAAKERTLMVGHTFLYNAAVNYLRDFVHSGELGEVFYVYMQRLNLGVIRSDINVMWNLAPHDVSIASYVLGMEPIAVSAWGEAYVQREIEDVVFMSLLFPDRIKVHIQVSWLDPHKVRKTTVVGKKKMIVYDDISDDKITIYDKGIDKKDLQPDLPFDILTPYTFIHRTGDIHIPKVDFKEPLKVEAAHFVECILTGKQPLSGPANGRAVVAILEAAQESLKNGNKFISF